MQIIEIIITAVCYSSKYMIQWCIVYIFRKTSKGKPTYLLYSIYKKKKKKKKKNKQKKKIKKKKKK